MKREAGESPARTRRCNDGVLFYDVTGVYWEGEVRCGYLSQKTCLFGVVEPRGFGYAIQIRKCMIGAVPYGIGSFYVSPEILVSINTIHKLDE